MFSAFIKKEQSGFSIKKDLLFLCIFLFLRILVDVENLEIVSSCRPLQLSQCVDRGVNLLVRDSGGCSALHLAAQSGHADLVRYILQQGEKVHVK